MSAAGVKGFRLHDCRCYTITELAESQAGDATIMALAGHVLRKMLEHYSHVRQEAKHEAVNLLSAKRRAGRQRWITAQTTTQIRFPPEECRRK